MRNDSTRILTVDIGNTCVTAGLYARRKITSLRYEDHRRVGDSGAIAQWLQKGYGNTPVERVLVSSVAPSRTPVWLNEVRRVTGLTGEVIDCSWDFGFKLNYPKPDTLGTDRLVNAAWAVYRFGAPVVVCDFGTCATLDLVLPETGFAGGVILPGMGLITDYMAEKTERLPRIPLNGPCRRVVGRSTEEAMRIGLLRGYPAMIRDQVEQLVREAGGPCPVCLTGGHVRWLPELRKNLSAVVEKNMTLLGIGRVGELSEAHRVQSKRSKP